MELKELKLTEKRKEICQRLSLFNSDDILNYYPFRYEMYDATPYREFREGSQVCFVGELVSYPSTFRKGKLSTSRFKVLYEEEILTVTIFNRPWIRNLKMNETLTVLGRYDGNNKVTASNYYSGDTTGSIIPYYPLKEGIGQNDIKKLIQSVYAKCKEELNDDLPQEFISAHHLIDRKTAIHDIHMPLSKMQLAAAISRLKYEEFLRFYLSLDILKGSTAGGTKEKKIFDAGKIESFIASFGFELTKDQRMAVDDILKDLSGDKLMYRLVQGEVGSGKTAVAIIGLYANCLAGYQGALMAPTEILAKQHASSLSKQLEPFGIKVGVLYSAMEEEKKIKEAVRNGEIDIVVGTHALFSKDVGYKKLGLVIADEQQRFGVRQRQALKEKGKDVDFLLMSATPIPRTLASSIYGDMDVSTIATLPAGRKGCKTYLIKQNSIVGILDAVKEKLQEGRQIYIVAAAIEASENYKAKDVNNLYESLNKEMKPYTVGLLHGKLSSQEKDIIMNSFAQNKIQVLVSTTVVEVGVNVKNATVMIVYDADKFGLSQLHQLRGRVQRSDYEGTCYLLTDNKDELALKRLNILCQSNDGFAISFEDLKLRGPGDILGTRQSGLPAFVLGNLIEDTRFIDAARKDAQKISEHKDEEAYASYYERIRKMASQNFIS
ncbi:MAG: ATP-dependent DNA helicase RecG [Erysipelotrichaceae bacterium]|nr:ATP-dependent DNA helicase RecG [Erysipelotrichaceae bacterium]